VGRDGHHTGVKIDKTQLVEVLRAQGDDEADSKVAGLPDEIDTERDADALTGIGLDQDTLRTKMAAGGLGGNLWA
jgi:hypothetical protein